MQRNFLIQTLSYAGIGDQIGMQFANLYKLGISLGYTYVHGVPFYFGRSHSPSYLERANEKLIRAIRDTTGITLNWRLDSNNLAEFLGVNDLDLPVQETAESQLEAYDLKLDQIIQSSTVCTFSDLSCAIEKAISSLNGNQPILFSWSNDMYTYLPKLRQMLEEVNQVSDFDVNSFFAKRYWATRKNWRVPLAFDGAEGRINVVLHMRLGDSTTIEVGNKKFRIHGSMICSESEFSSLVAIDPTRTHICDISKYAAFLDCLFSKYGEENFHCTILSDGYDATFHMVRHARKEGKIQLTRHDLKQLAVLEKELNSKLRRQFSRYTNTTAIIGETNSNLYRSIHALASSDIVVYGTGGFASSIHRFFKQPERKTLMVNIKDCGEAVFNEIGQMVSTRNVER